MNGKQPNTCKTSAGDLAQSVAGFEHNNGNSLSLPTVAPRAPTEHGETEHEALEPEPEPELEEPEPEPELEPELEEPELERSQRSQSQRPRRRRRRRQGRARQTRPRSRRGATADLPAAA